MKSTPSGAKEAVPDKKLEKEAALIKRLQEFELRSDQRGILSNDKISPARFIDKLQCDPEIRDKVEGQFERLHAGKISDSDGIVLKSIDNHIAACVKMELITNAEQGRAYMIEILKVLLVPIDKINNTNEVALPQSERDEKVTDYSKNLDENLARLFKIKENIMSGLPIMLFHPITQQVMQAKGLNPPDPTSLLQNAQACKNRVSMLFIQEALTQEISDKLINKYDRLSKLVDESVNILNSYQVKEPINLDKLKALAEMANALQTLLLPNAINSENITPITNQLRTNLLITYEHILEAEKSLNPEFVAKSSSTLGNISTALAKDEKLVPPQIKRTSFSKPTVKPEGLVKSVSNIMPAPEKLLSKDELSTDMFVGHTCQFAHYYSKSIDNLLDDEINKYSVAVRDLLSGALDAGYSSASVKGTSDGKILAIIKNSIAEAITNGDIITRADGNSYVTTYRDIVLKHLQKITETDKYAKNPNLINDEIIDPMKLEILQAEKSLKINTSLKTAPSNTAVFQQDSQNALIKQGINHPAQSFLTEVQLFKNNIAARFLSEAQTQGFSDELANKYIRLNTLIDESLKIVNSYKAKQPVNLEKLKAIAELANALQAVCKLPPNAVNSESITPITNQLRTNLSVTSDNIYQAEKSKGRLAGFIAKSSSTVGNITTALQKDENLMSPETKKAFFSAKEKPIVKPEGLTKSVSNILRR